MRRLSLGRWVSRGVRCAAVLLIADLAACGPRRCERELADAEAEVQALRAALRQANANIAEANDRLESAQGAAYTTYAEMAEKLEGLDTVDEVPEP